MSDTPKRLPAVLGLAVGLACLNGCSVMQRGASQPMEFISMPFAYEGDTLVWNVGYSVENNVERITEFVRRGQTVENWTELVTLHEFNKAVGLKSVDEILAAHRNDLMARCPGSTLEVIQQQPDGVLYELRVVNCEAGADEHGLGRVLNGNSTRFMVQYAVRDTVAMIPERHAEWIDKLLALRIMNMPSRR